MLDVTKTEKSYADGKILKSIRDGVGIVTFNNPEKRNAMSLEMWEGLGQALIELRDDDSVRVVVLVGAGDKAFVSGADISEFEEQRRDTASSLNYGAQTEAAYTAVRCCPKPTAAMIYGYCMGGAMAIAMGCDMRFAAEGSKFGIPAARLNIVYPVNSVGQLVDLVGPAFAKDILFSARAVGDRERVIASTDCGFGTFTNREWVIEPAVWLKLKSLREGADIASGRLWGRKVA